MGSWARGGWLLGAMVVAALPACGRVGFDPQQQAAVDASDSESDADGEPSNLVANPGCEGSDGLDGWSGYQGELSLSTTTFRSGTQACVVCTDANASESSIDDDAGSLPVSAGQTYVARAFVRALPADAASREAFVALRQWEDPDDPNSTRKVSEGPEIELSADEWRELTVTHVVEPAAEQRLDLYIFQRGDGGDCMVVDDVSLVLVE